MIGMRRVFLGVFALISSCGQAPEGASDTAAVAPATQPPATGPFVMETVTVTGTPVPSEPSPPPQEPDRAVPSTNGAELVGFAGSRFAVIDTTAGGLVFDSESSAAFGVYGHPVHGQAGGWDIWSNVGFQDDILKTQVEVSANGERLLVRTATGIQAVDLTKHGALLAGWRGDARGTTIAPDGETFATWTDSAITLVRIADSAQVSYPLTTEPSSGPHIEWTSRSASWTDGAGAHIVDRATWRAQNAELPGAAITMTKDGSVAVVHRDAFRDGDVITRPGDVEIWRSGERTPAARITSAFVDNVILDEAGAKVAWVEYSGVMESAAHLHTVDVATGIHVRFPSKAENCTIAHEWLIGIENGELRTDGECSPGCASITRQSDFRAYDIRTGRVLRHWMGELQRPFGDELSEKTVVAQRLAKHFKFDDANRLPMVHHPALDLVVVERPGALRVADQVAGGTVATLERSSEFTAENVHFWPKTGVRVVGIGASGVVVWDAVTGERVWSSVR
jgi:hypothetical protein